MERIQSWIIWLLPLSFTVILMNHSFVRLGIKCNFVFSSSSKAFTKHHSIFRTRIKSHSQHLIRCEREIQKYRSTSARQTHSIVSKAPKQLLNRAWSYFIVFEPSWEPQVETGSQSKKETSSLYCLLACSAINHSPAGSDRLWRPWRQSRQRRRCGTPRTWGWAARQCGPSSW